MSLCRQGIEFPLLLRAELAFPVRAQQFANAALFRRGRCGLSLRREFLEAFIQDGHETPDSSDE